MLRIVKRKADIDKSVSLELLQQILVKYVYIRKSTVTPYNKGWWRHESKRKTTWEQINAEISVFFIQFYISFFLFFCSPKPSAEKATQPTEEFLKTLLSRCLIPRETESSGRAEK